MGLARFARSPAHNLTQNPVASRMISQVHHPIRQPQMASVSLHIDNGVGTGSYHQDTFKVVTGIPANVYKHMPNFAIAIPLLLTYAFPSFLNGNTTLPEPNTCVTNHYVSKTINGIFAAPVPPNVWCFNISIIL